METYLPQTRADRLIGVSRLVLAIFALAALRLDSDLAGSNLRAMTLTSLLFIVYAVILLGASWRWLSLTHEARVAIHVTDFLVISLFLALTRGAASGFFVFFVFCLFSATLRFGIQGTVATALAAMAVFVGIAVPAHAFVSDPGLIVLRLAALAVVALLLVYIRHYYERVQEELQTLSTWPAGAGSDRNTAAAEMLRLITNLVGVPRGVLVWEEREEPWVYLATLSGPEATMSREGPDAMENAVASDLEDASFFVEDASKPTPTVETAKGRRAPGIEPIGTEFRERFDIRSVLSVPVPGDLVRGRIFLLDRKDVTRDDIALAQIAARLVASRLDQLQLAEKEQSEAIVDERVRVARDLHDGLLQSLTGAALQLEVIQREAGENEALRNRLRSVQDVIELDQRELRSFIVHLRPDAAGRPDTSLRARLSTISPRFHEQWGVAVEMSLDPAANAIPERLASEVFSIVSEAVANAAKHAGAQWVSVAVSATDSILQVTVQDDGRGFPFLGSFTLAELDHQRRGPVTLKQRVAALHGTLRLESTPTGSRIEIELPV